jgi:plastocyanin
VKQLDRKKVVIAAIALGLFGITAGMYFAGELPALIARQGERTNTVKTIWSEIRGDEKTTTTRTTETVYHSHDGLPMHKHVVTVTVAVTETTPHDTFHDFPATQTAVPVSSTVTGHNMTGQPDSNQGQQIMVIGREFMPATVNITAGTKVTWTSKESEVHTVTSDTGLFNGTLTTNGEFSYTFTEPGVYKYHCENRPEMTGTITVN